MSVTNNRPPSYIRAGREIPKLHEKYQAFQQTNRAKDNKVDPEEMAVAVLGILKQVDAINALQHDYDLLTGRLRRGPSVIMPPPFSFVWRIPARVTNSSNE
jgi:hypothetical protein